MSVVLGINAVFHDPAAALVVDGQIVACAEEERFSRRKHGKEAVPFSTWEVPAESARWCLEQAGLEPGDVGTVVHVYPQDQAYEVEFVALDGATAAVETIEASKVRPVRPREITHARG